MNLSENYRIIYDENNVVLQFFEMRLKEKKDGTTELYEYVDNYYYPNIKTALKRFLQEKIKYSESIDEVLKRIDEVENIILNLKFK